MNATLRIPWMVPCIALAALLGAEPLLADEKCKTFDFTGLSAESPTSGDEGLEISVKVGGQTLSCTVNFPAGLVSNGEAAQAIVDQCNGGNFTITRVGNRVTICHESRNPKIKKVNIKDLRTASVSAGTALRSENLFEVRGVALGGGELRLVNGSLQVTATTRAGQGAEELVDLLVEELARVFENHADSASFGTEFRVSHFGGPPQDSVDLGIHRLGGLDLDRTELVSSDPGIWVFQEPLAWDYPVSCPSDGAECPCGPPAPVGQGCPNSTGAPAVLRGEGGARLSDDSLNLRVSQVPNQPGLFFQGRISLGQGVVFGDGLRCCGGQILRLATVLAQGHQSDLAGGLHLDGDPLPISQHPGNAGLLPGESRCYQYWHRDPGPANPCQMSWFNLSNSIEVLWAW